MSTNDPYATPDQPQYEFRYVGEQKPIVRKNEAGDIDYILYPGQPRKTNGLAIAGFVLGILWLGWIGSALAIIFGHVALKQVEQKNEGGEGLAIAGLVLGYVGAATFALFVVLPLLAAAGA